MKNYLTTSIKILVAAVCIGLSGNAYAQEVQETKDPAAVISKDLTKFSHIRIIDVTKNSPGFYRMWGYPGIWIKQTEEAVGKITYNNVCTPYLSTEIVGDTLVVNMSQEFLYPRSTNWNPANGMIKAIEIEVPRQYGLASIYNDGGYQFNTTLMNVECKSLAVASSNSFRLLNCKIKKMMWWRAKDAWLADGCRYSLILKLSEIGVLSIAEESLPVFEMGDNVGSKIKKYECRKK